MKLTSLTLLSAASALAACGTVATTSAGADDIDYARVNAVNNAARAQGVQVHWINFPQRLKSTSAVKPGGAG